MKREAVGVDDFKEFVDNDLYFVDKTMLIKEIIDDASKVVLITRPRRFGKTLNMSLLKYYFEKTDTDKSYLFNSFNIWNQGEKYKSEFNKYPVINLTLKNAKYNNWKINYNNLKILISNEYRRHSYLLNSDKLDDFEKEDFTSVLKRNSDDAFWGSSLEFLSSVLSKHYEKKVVILLDEYDTLLNESYIHGFYDEAIDFIKAFLNAGFKNNNYLHKGIITGIFRVAKESIFSDMNNLNVCTMLDNDYREFFGFTKDEVKSTLSYFKLDKFTDKVTEWYNGYIFGETKFSLIYNPWSMIMFINKKSIKPYWINTSGNAIIKRLILQGDKEVKEDIKKIIQNKSLKNISVDENIVYSTIESSKKSIWSFLLFSGYLKAVKTEIIERKGTICTLKATNMEVLYLFRTIVEDWMAETISGGRVNMLLDALLNGDTDTLHELLYRTIFEIASYNDVGINNSENFYHAFVLGLLVQLEDDYEVLSNRESGIGRYDVMLIPKNINKNGIIIEFKSARLSKNESLDELLDQALKQIEDKKYDTELKRKGIKNIIKWAIAFKGKEVRVGRK
jgi:hypothetical protein